MKKLILLLLCLSSSLFAETATDAMADIYELYKTKNVDKIFAKRFIDYDNEQKVKVFKASLLKRLNDEKINKAMMKQLKGFSSVNPKYFKPMKIDPGPKGYVRAASFKFNGKRLHLHQMHDRTWKLSNTNF